IQAEVERVAGEATHLGWLDEGLNFVGGFLDIGDELGLADQAGAVAELVEVGRRWVDEQYPNQRDEAAAAGDMAHAQRLVEASERILSTYTHTSPVHDEMENFDELADDVRKSVKAVVKLPGYGMFAAGGGIAGVALAITIGG